MHSEAGQSRDSQKLFAKATLIKPKTAAEVAAKSYPNVNHYQQQILSPVSTIASETSQSQGKPNLLSPNNPSIILTTQDGMGGKLFMISKLLIYFDKSIQSLSNLSSNYKT